MRIQLDYVNPEKTGMEVLLDGVWENWRDIL